MGVRDKELLWFKNYLSGRWQYTVVGGVCSSLHEILLGVPQGSILGPLLFFIYINDLPMHTSLLSLLFADDATILAKADSLEELFEITNKELYKITCYFRKNLLSIHPEKTNYMIFSTKNTDCHFKLSLNLNNPNSIPDPRLITDIPQITSNDDIPAVKFLGLYIDPNLNFKYHISTIRKKISSALYFLRKSKNLLNTKSLTALYYSLIHTHIIYAIQIWSSCSNDQINMIFKLQKKAIRIIHSLPYNGHTEPFFKSSNILPLPKLIEFFRLQFMQQYVQGYLPRIFDSTWIINANRNFNQPYLLRNHNDLFVPVSRLSSFDKHPLYIIPKLWSEFNIHEIKIQRVKTIFNFKLKSFLIEILATNYICTRILCPSCHLRVENLDSE